MSLQHIQKNSPGLLPKPAKFEKNPPNGYRVIRKTKCGAGGAAGAGRAGSSPIHKQASLVGRLIMFYKNILKANLAGKSFVWCLASEWLWKNVKVEWSANIPSKISQCKIVELMNIYWLSHFLSYSCKHALNFFGFLTYILWRVYQYILTFYITWESKKFIFLV